MNGAEGNLPVDPPAGTSWQRERHWGVIGGLVGAVVGAGFLVRALIALRVGRYPRSDGYGATLIGLILCALGCTILFVRLVAVLAG